MKRKSILTILFALILSLSFGALPALADQPSGLTAPTGLNGPSSLGNLITIVTNLLLGIAGAVAVIFIVIGAIQYSTSAGNEQSTAKAKSTITSAVIGLIISILALGIVNFVLATFT
jgi:hypothetical protein